MMIAERTQTLLAQGEPFAVVEMPTPTSAFPPPLVQRGRSSTMIRPVSATGMFPIPSLLSDRPRRS
jgi:hypothetical protein